MANGHQMDFVKHYRHYNKIIQSLFIYLCCFNICLCLKTNEIVQLKFGDRLTLRHRPYHVGAATTTTSTTTTTQPPPPSIKPTDDNYENLHFSKTNDISNRNDDYVATDDYGNNKYYFIENRSKDNKKRSKNSSLIALDVFNKSITPAPARLEMVTEFFDIPPSQMLSVYTLNSRAASNASKSGVVLATKTNYTASGSILGSSSLYPIPTTNFSNSSSGLRKEPWVVPVLVLACLSMLMMGAFEVFVLCKTRQTSPNRRHLFLGQMLLLGLFSCSGLSAILTAKPSTLSCATIRFGAGISFAIVFASLLVKCIFLISLNDGVYLPAPYQGLLLLFAVLIQVTIGVQWLITAPPGIRLTSNGIAVTNRLVLTSENLNTMTIQLCRTSFSELLMSLIYVGCLIIFVLMLAIKSRGIRDNYREATYIGLAIGGTIPIWIGWTLCGLIVQERHRDACLAFGLVATSSLVFLVMFMPKGRQLAAMGREDLYMEDHEEQFSASSRAGSGYSPAFFHFKPIKYGVMNQKSNENVLGNNKHQQAVNTLGGGKLCSLLMLLLML